MNPQKIGEDAAGGQWIVWQFLMKKLLGIRFLRRGFLEVQEPGKVGVQGAEGVQIRSDATIERSLAGLEGQGQG